MPALTTTRNYADAQVLDEQDLDDAFDSIETLLNTTKLDGDNLQTGGVPTAAIAALAVTAAKIDADAVTTVKIQDAAVTAAKLAAAVAGAGLAGGAGTALSVNVDDSTIEINTDTLRVKAAGITRAKLEAVGQQLSSSSGSYTMTAGSYAAVTNLTVAITTTGRPVSVRLVGAGGSSGSSLGAYATGGASTTTRMDLIFKRDSTTIENYIAGATLASSASNQMFFAPSAFSALDTPSAGTYTYTVEVKTLDTNTGIAVSNCKLLAYEL